MTHNDYLKTDHSIFGDVFTSNEIWDNLRILTDEYGSRFGGTEGERLAAEFLRDKMKAYGLENVVMEPFDYLGWKRGEATLEILEPLQRSLACISLPHSPARSVEGILVDMGDGAPRDFDMRADDIHGNIVLTNSVVSPPGASRWIHRNEKLGRSMMAGAAAFIFVNHYPGYGAPTGGIGYEGRAAHIPGIGMSYEDGAYLSRLVQQHGTVRVRITTRDELFDAVSWNVTGELPGASDELVMLGCHYDGHDIAQGAEDPASGAVAVLEAARVLSKYGGELTRRVRFAFWGVEEIGLLGSTRYVADHADELDKIKFYFNMDSAGAIKEKGVVLNEWHELAPIFKTWSVEMAHPFLVGQSVNAHSDHFPFLLQGVPTGGMEAVKRSLAGRGYGHTAYDTLDKVKVGSLREAAALSARLMLRVANAGEWPAARRRQEEVDALFTGAQYEEAAAYRAAIKEFYAGVA